MNMSLPMSIIGRNTTMVVRVASVMASPTSDAPLTAASRLLRPRDLTRSMFSDTTIPLSTSIPTASIKPISVNRFNE